MLLLAIMACSLKPGSLMFSDNWIDSNTFPGRPDVAPTSVDGEPEDAAAAFPSWRQGGAPSRGVRAAATTCSWGAGLFVEHGMPCPYLGQYFAFTRVPQVGHVRANQS